MMETTVCPDCDAVAEVLECDVLESTDGPVEQAVRVCRFLVSAPSAELRGWGYLCRLDVEPGPLIVAAGRRHGVLALRGT